MYQRPKACFSDLDRKSPQRPKAQFSILGWMSPQRPKARFSILGWMSPQRPKARFSSGASTSVRSQVKVSFARSGVRPKWP